MKIQFDIPPASAQESNGLAVRYAAAKRRVPRWRWYLLLALVLVPPASFLLRMGIAYWWQTTPAQIILEQATLRADVAGHIAHVAHTGDTLQSGDFVVKLTAPIAAAATPAKTRQTPIPPVRTPAWTTRQATLVEAERLVRSQLALQQQRLRRMQALRQQGAATQQELDNAQFQMLQAQADVNRAQADSQEHRALLLTPESAPATEATPAPALPTTRGVAAPFAATVLRSLVREGDWVTPGAELAVLQSHSEPLVHAYLPAEQARYAQIGHQATLRFMDGGRVRARVVGIATEAQSTPADRVSPLNPRPPSIVVHLQALEPLPAGYRIQLLPLDVRFDRMPGAWL